MRWGVRDEATDDHMTTELCMREIMNCQRLSMGPNFVVSHGWYGYCAPFAGEIAQHANLSTNHPIISPPHHSPREHQPLTLFLHHYPAWQKFSFDNISSDYFFTFYQLMQVWYLAPVYLAQAFLRELLGALKTKMRILVILANCDMVVQYTQTKIKICEAP